MKKKLRIPIDLSSLHIAFDDATFNFEYYVDLKTGEVLMIPNEFIDGEEEETNEINERIEEGFGTRYISIPNISSEEGYKDMEDFIERIEDEDLQEKLYIAIDGQGAFRRFKDVLLDYPDERERWFEFKEDKVAKRINEWLIEEGIEPIVGKPNEEEKGFP